MTEDDLEIAEASLTFALQNCPVEGILSTEDGAPVTLDMLQELLDRLKEVESNPDVSLPLRRNEISQLEAVVSYTYENCPIEGVSTFHDGRMISGSESAKLVSKVKKLLETLPSPPNGTETGVTNRP